MPLDYPNTVPVNHLRLPDALTVEYGPTQLLARFALEADKAARDAGIRLFVRYDFEALAEANEAYSSRGLWYPLVEGFNPRRVDLTPENAVWISGEDEDGRIVATWAARIYNWVGTNLAEQARTVWYGNDQGQPCVVTAEAARDITGVVCFAGASWVHPDYRGKHFSRLLPRAGKCYAASRWPLDWATGYIGRSNVDKGLANNYGQQNLSYSVFYPGSPHGEQVVSYTPIREVYADLAMFLLTGFSDSDVAEAVKSEPLASVLEHIVTNTSAEGVFHGSMSRS